MRRLCGGFAVRFQEAAFIGVDVGVYETWLKDGCVGPNPGRLHQRSPFNLGRPAEDIDI